jgi:putative PIN family toxin of toxin-antitoxin system
MAEEKIKSVFDCNVYLQAFLSGKGAAHKCRKLVDEDSIELYISRDIFNEIRDVLTRPEICAKFPHATAEAAAAFIEDINKRAVFVRSVKKHFELPRDRKDEPYVNLAVEIGADYIVSRDQDLLDLMTDFDATGKMFRQKFRQLKVVEPIEFLRIIKERNVHLNL